MRYYIVGCDNRGTDVCPFGRIYLATTKNGESVGSIGYGAHRDDPDPYAVWPMRDTPQYGRDPDLLDRAKAYLKKTFPKARTKGDVAADPNA